MTRLRRKLRWFNWSCPYVKVGGKYIRLWNAFNRHTSDGEHWWGFGLLSISSRHLVYVGYTGWHVLFIGQTP